MSERTPAAFPSPGVVLNVLAHPKDGPPRVEQRQQGAYDGMSLRDYFAAKAMPALLMSARNAWGMERPGSPIGLAAQAYEIANAMLKAREQ